MTSRFLIPLAVAAALAAPVAANADAYPGQPKGDWLFRIGLSDINPKHNNADLGDGVTLAVDDNVGLTGNITYMLTDHLGTELLLAYPFTHGIDVWTAPGTKVRVGDTKVLPPTLSLQWHFNPTGKINPYLGVGVNYTIFSSENTRGPLEGTKLHLDNTWGPAVDFGIDWYLNKHWFFNTDIRYIVIEPNAHLDTGDGTVDLPKIKIDPTVYGVHIGYRLSAPAPLPPPKAAPPPPPPPPPPQKVSKCPDTPAGVKVDSVGCPLEMTLKVLFDFDKAELRPESITELEKVVKFMNDVPFATALIEGHTDNKGSKAYNVKLSDRRAKA
ncbi:MAG TPA: OmpW family outer membrane protein, partial [Steroidobacteraceae bacterium]|nr:OmpW family outer membrane protein [Steroidobacteraceae bacterium]